MIEELGAELDIISALEDEPNDVGGLTAAELKARFDEAGNIIKNYINGTLLPGLNAENIVFTLPRACRRTRFKRRWQTSRRRYRG